MRWVSIWWISMRWVSIGVIGVIGVVVTFLPSKEKPRFQLPDYAICF
tara:strand:+ start:3179 stop:3319 length:141 start_codon:yes stop_codon:yes gene_type:complete